MKRSKRSSRESMLMAATDPEQKNGVVPTSYGLMGLTEKDAQGLAII